MHCYTCDATCGLYNIWERNLKPPFSHMVSLPYMAIAESLNYAVAEFGVLIEKLESFTGKGFSPEILPVSRVDGAILHSNRSCKPISMGQLDMQRHLSEELGIPSVMLDGDHMDPDRFTMSQFQSRIDPFMELLQP